MLLVLFKGQSLPTLRRRFSLAWTWRPAQRRQCLTSLPVCHLFSVCCTGLKRSEVSTAAVACVLMCGCSVEKCCCSCSSSNANWPAAAVVLSLFLSSRLSLVHNSLLPLVALSAGNARSLSWRSVTECQRVCQHHQLGSMLKTPTAALANVEQLKQWTRCHINNPSTVSLAHTLGPHNSFGSVHCQWHARAGDNKVSTAFLVSQVEQHKREKNKWQHYRVAKNANCILKWPAARQCK